MLNRSGRAKPVVDTPCRFDSHLNKWTSERFNIYDQTEGFFRQQVQQKASFTPLAAAGYTRCRKTLPWWKVCPLHAGQTWTFSVQSCCRRLSDHGLLSTIRLDCVSTSRSGDGLVRPCRRHGHVRTYTDDCAELHAVHVPGAGCDQRHRHDERRTMNAALTDWRSGTEEVEDSQISDICLKRKLRRS